MLYSFRKADVQCTAKEDWFAEGITWNFNIGQPASKKNGSLGFKLQYWVTGSKTVMEIYHISMFFFFFTTSLSTVISGDKSQWWQSSCRCSVATVVTQERDKMKKPGYGWSNQTVTYRQYYRHTSPIYIYNISIYIYTYVLLHMYTYNISVI